MMQTMKIQGLIFALMIGVLGCKKKDVSTQMDRAWIMKQAVHIPQGGGGRTKVYERGQAGNLFNYDGFLLDLSNQNALQFTDIGQGGDRFDFTGKWRVDQNVRLVLFELSPEPTCSEGVDCAKEGIQFFIDKISDTELKINRLYVSDKTGNTVNEYTLIPK
ncbi:hypothetical protein DVG78_08620 [Runella aurantiaca]|uniref:Uncharacterized protein n=2 Tax=Runella aurantiaca TaxID=2282308 RepID=A0A369ICZ3_9BACT|nr:hypothetical protein DVG78_08620 [Runella aurantiaca]